MNDGPPLPAAGERALPIVVVGHVDHGKSTLVGRLLHDTGSLPAARVEQLRAVSAKRGLDLEFSFLLDSLQVERDLGVTVDAAQIWFRTARRRYVIIDAPGHAEFLRNMVTGAAAAEAAVLVVDAQQGVAEQTRRHGYLLGILGLEQVAVAVNKVDLIDRDPARFAAVKAEVEEYLAGIGLRAGAVIPLSAKHGDNVARTAADTMPWYSGPTLVEALDDFAPRPEPSDGPLRLPVQDVYRAGDRRVVVGRIESGRLSVGDELRFAPGSQTARIAAVEAWNGAAPPRRGAARKPARTSPFPSTARSSWSAATSPAAPRTARRRATSPPCACSGWTANRCAPATGFRSASAPPSARRSWRRSRR
jgi:bifunctional enzyme CysN/CysC